MSCLRASFCLMFAVSMLPSLGANAQDPNPPSIHSDRGAWPIRRQWNMEEVRHYAKWVEHLYEKKTKGTVEQRIAKVDVMLTDPDMNLLMDPAFLGTGSNPQLPAGTIRSVHSMIDCGKFTAFLPAYYAYRRALPWMSSYVRSGGGDIRTAPRNFPAGVESSFTSPSLSSFFLNTIGGFSSGNYRVELEGPNVELSDTVPVGINQEYLLPGCVNYVDGHCLLLARVTDYGELQFINASTTHTRDIFTYNGMNTVAGITPRGIADPANPWSGCYQGLRVFRFPIAETDSKGRVIKVRRRTNEEMREFGFSTEQYTVLEEMYKTQHIKEGGFQLESFHDLVRMRMRTVEVIKPMEFMEQYCDELKQVFDEREAFVQAAWQDVKQNGGIVYPEERSDENIFQAFGRWETWSSPSSDVDRRNKYFYLADWMDYCIRWFGIKPELIDLAGFEKYEIRSQADLAKAFVQEKTRMFLERKFSYTKSNGQPVELTLLDVENRLFDLSFDPNHPPELRWGAPENSEERAGMPQTTTPVPGGARVAMDEAYRLQYFYRTVCQRETEMSILRGMFTSGFPIRDRLEGQMTKWVSYNKPTEAIAMWLGESSEPAVEEPKEPAHILVPKSRSAMRSQEAENERSS
ncbi:MAG: hypothetical protein AMXMBFR84_07680 [Candidatus Hydrogenedentota bacterium]